ncbi:MAG: hypothetical protein ABI723_13815, partial [Bacteroidia bacterium]
LNQRAQSHNYLDQLSEAMSDAEIILKYASLSLHRFDIASALKTKALIKEKTKQNSEADLLFKKSIEVRIRINDAEAQIADDYTDWGNFYLNTMH